MLAAPILRGFFRFIPTCVGKTAAGRAHRESRAVHPHVCGENDRFRYGEHRQSRFIPTCVGKTRPSLAQWACRWRFIPTCVGKTFPTPAYTMQRTGSSPRVWGKRAMSDSNSIQTSGSSPRVWGKRVILITSKPRKRFIPTCVGKTDGSL